MKMGKVDKTIILDVETKKGLSKINWDRTRLNELQISVAGIYSYNLDKFLVFEEKGLSRLEKILKDATRVVGFNLLNFDYQVLAPYFSFDLFSLPTLDILKEIKKAAGHRVSLDSLAIATLGTQKTGSGLEAIRLYRKGMMDELKKYCLSDVKITRDLYEYGLRHGVLHFASRNGWSEYTITLRWQAAQKKETIEEIIKRAFEEKKRLEIEYVSRTAIDGESYRKTRKIDISAIDEPYIEAFCHLRQEKRSFRLDRILKARLVKKS